MGESMREGIRLAVEEINGFVGGFQGKKIELIERDDKADNQTGARIAEEFVQKKVVAAIGIVNTGVGLASIDAYQKAKIPLMIAVATGTTLTHKYAPPAAPENYIFRTSPTLDLEAKILANDLSAMKHLTKVAILADSTAYGNAGLKAFKEQSALSGLTLTAEDRFNIGDKDMSAQVAHAKNSGAEAIVVWGIGPELAVIAKNKQALGWKVPMLGSWTLSMDNFTQIAGKAGDGVQFPQTFVQHPGPGRDYFLHAYYKDAHTMRIPSPMSAAQGYDGMFLLYRAMLQAQSTDGREIKNALENLKYRYDGAITRYKRPYTPTDHNAITQNMYFLCKLQDGQIEYVYSEDEKRATFMRSKQK
jgi:branched-chain amino acid transport system substrate-binding protein